MNLACVKEREETDRHRRKKTGPCQKAWIQIPILPHGYSLSIRILWDWSDGAGLCVGEGCLDGGLALVGCILELRFGSGHCQ